MNGPHDVGGLHGFPTVVAEPGEPVFHDQWEGRMCGVSLALAAVGNHVVDEFRHALEHMPHADYYRKSYFERWLWTTEKLLHDKGVLSHDEVEARVAEIAAGADFSAGEGDNAASDLASAMHGILVGPLPPHLADLDRAPRFAPGDLVTTANVHIKEHLRLPGYAKRHSGWIHSHRGAFNHPRWLADGAQRRPEHLYTVGFTAGELWGDEAERPYDEVFVDIFEDYLEPRRDA